MKVNQGNNLIRKRIRTVAENEGLSLDVQNVLVNLFDYMIKKKMYGCCHAFSSALYVALCELGEKPELCVGECYNPNEKPFDHSWITLNGKVIDLAVYMPLTQKCNSITGVIIMDIDISNMKKHNTIYGYETGLGFGMECSMIMQMPFTDYMNNYPFEHNGLWSVVEELLPDMFNFDIQTARIKYANTRRKVCYERNK